LGNVSRDKALAIAAHAVHLLATVVPTAKQQSFAAYNLADLVLVSFSDMPISLANAFESPIKKKEGFLNPSIFGLVDYWHTVHQGYGLDERVAAFTLKKAALPATSLTIQSSLPALELWIRQDGSSEA
jgi:CRISPR system Cascade subunit CasC